MYRARRPFHPGRIYDQFMDPYFVLRYEQNDEGGSEENNLQKEAAAKGKKRLAVMGELLRSKGFVWMASTNFVMGAWQQAGNILR